jgi:uncharacterized membrane protein YuzA (DUF378 family)
MEIIYRPVMSEPTEMRPIPASTFQLVGQTTQDVVGHIGRTPLMLGVITLNIVGIAAAVYFLNLLISGQQQHLENLLKVQTANLETIIKTHDREFDALMAMNAKVAEVLQQATPQTIVTPQQPITPSRGGAR